MSIKRCFKRSVAPSLSLVGRAILVGSVLSFATACARRDAAKTDSTSRRLTLRRLCRGHCDSGVRRREHFDGRDGASCRLFEAYSCSSSKCRCARNESDIDARRRDTCHCDARRRDAASPCITRRRTPLPR